jgi:GT2 family glycosyltransferase
MVAFTGQPVSIQAQSVLYNNELEDIHRALSCLGRAAEIAKRSGCFSVLEVALGDSSPIPCLSPPDLKDIEARYGNQFRFRYDFFDGNLGSARGHNRLAGAASTDFIMVRNPDVVVSPTSIVEMVQPFSRCKVGIVEAKQLPFEHPKAYDLHTGETSWGSTACVLTATSIFRQVNGFDADSFFLYCDDVDFSWRVRLAGFRVLCQPAAIAFHDKRLSREARWIPKGAERYYSAEAALILAYKWSRDDVVAKISRSFRESSDEFHIKALLEFETRKKERRLPDRLDPEHRIGQFIDGYYAKNRFTL